MSLESVALAYSCVLLKTATQTNNFLHPYITLLCQSLNVGYFVLEFHIIVVGTFRIISEKNSLKSSLDPIYPTPPLGQDMTQGQFFKIFSWWIIVIIVNSKLICSDKLLNISIFWVVKIIKIKHFLSNLFKFKIFERNCNLFKFKIFERNCYFILNILISVHLLKNPSFLNNVFKTLHDSN